MGCTKPQLLNLFDYILNIIDISEDKEEIKKRVLELRTRIQTKAWAEIEEEIFG